MNPVLPLRIKLEPLTPGSPPLALAMQCWPEAERAAQLESLRLLTLADSGGFLLLSGWRGGNLVGALLAQQLPGKAATLWPAQLEDGETDTASRQNSWRKPSGNSRPAALSFARRCFQKARTRHPINSPPPATSIPPTCSI